MDALTGRETDVMPTDVNCLVMRTDQMHLNAPQCLIIKGVMLKSVGIKVGPHQIIHTLQDVAIKSRCHARGIVISRLQSFGGFVQINADQHAAIRSNQARRLL